MSRGHHPSPGGTGVIDGTVGGTDEELLRRYLCIHHPHKVSPAAYAAMAHPRVVRGLTAVIGPNVKAMQSMLFIKSEGKPGQAWHTARLPTARHPVPDAGAGRPALRLHDRGLRLPVRRHDAVPVEIPAGTALFFNGYLLHRSLQNSGKHGYRRALANHYMSAESLLPWRPPRDGEHMAMVDYRDIVMVAGTDPYAYKGVEDLARPYSRPDRYGGCDR